VTLPPISDPQRLRRLLFGLARNPAAPPDVLVRLLRLPPAAREIAWRRADVTSELGEQILNLGDAQAAASLGHNRRLPTSIRWQLATHPDPDVRASAARQIRPKDLTPGCEVPQALLMQLADDPHPTVRARIADHPDTPTSILTRLASDPDADVRKTLAQRWTAPPADIHRVLLTDPAPAVRAAALSLWHPAPPQALLPSLLAEPETCADAVPHAALTDELARHLARSPDPLVREALARHRDLPAPVREVLAHDPDPIPRIGLVLSPATPEQTRQQVLASLRADPDDANQCYLSFALGNAWKDRSQLGWLRALPLPQRLAYLESPHTFFRQALADSPDLPDDAVLRLLADPDPQTRRIAARNHDVPGPILEQLVTEHGEDHSFRPLLIEHPNFPPDAFSRFAKSHDTRLRRLACQHPGLPADLVAVIAADPDPATRRAAAEHPNLTADCLPRLLTDDDLDVAEAAATSRAIPETWMRTLLNTARL
jgi:hypothetical protein